MDKQFEDQDKPLILIAEDEPSNLRLLSNILRKEDYRKSMAGNGRQALELVNNVQPDLILLDIVMPEMDGLEVCKRLKQSPGTRDIPIIFITARIQHDYIVEGLQAGAVDYVTKPFNPTELLARVRTHIELKRSKDRIVRINNELEAAYQTLEKELSEAGAYVESLLPPPLASNPRTDWCFRASGKLGGDIFGYGWIDEDHFALYMLDVDGHGIRAALRSVSLMHLLSSQTLENTDFRNPSRVLARLDENVMPGNQKNKCFSIWYGVYKRSGHRLIYSGAGHPPALLLTGPNAGEALKENLETPGTAVGATPGFKYENREVKLDTFSRLFLFSDGVYETRKKSNGEMWSLREWLDVLAESGRSPSVDPEGLLRYVQELAGTEQLDDDFALLGIQFQHP